jgi:MFS family permease
LFSKTEGAIDRTSAHHPLFNRDFRRLWIGNTVSGCGDNFFLVALPWLILQLSESGAVLGEIMMVAAVPRSVLMLLGGAVTDRISPRKIMIFAASVRSLLVAALATFIWTHSLELWQLYVLVFLFGVADAFAIPAGQTLLPSLVGPGQLAAAISLSQLTEQISRLIVPAPAGIAVATFGTAWVLLIDAISFLFIIAALYKLGDPPEAESTGPRRNIHRSIIDGLYYVKSDVPLRSLLLVVSVLNFCIVGPMSVGIAFLAKRQLGSPAGFGLLMTSVAAGGLAGLLLAAVLRQRKRGPLLLSVSTVVGISTASIGLINNLWVLFAILFVMNASAGFLNVQLLAWIQQRVARALLGRVMSVLLLASAGLVPFSLAAAGVAIQWSLRGMFVGAGVLVLAVTFLAALVRPVREIE